MLALGGKVGEVRQSAQGSGLHAERKGVVSKSAQSLMLVIVIVIVTLLVEYEMRVK